MKLKKLWQALDGWKLIIGVTLIFGSRVWDAMHNGHTGDFIGSILTALNWMPTGDWTGPAMTAAAGGVIALVGFVMKLVKAWQQSRAGATSSELLSTPGYAKLAAVQGFQPAVSFGAVTPEQIGFIARALYALLKIFTGGTIHIGKVDIPLPMQNPTIPTGGNNPLNQPHQFGR